MSRSATGPSTPAQAGAEHGGGAVGRGQAQGEGVAAGLPGGAVALGGALGLGELGDPAGGRGVRGDGVLVRGDQGDVAVLVARSSWRAAVRQPVGGDLGAVGGLAGGQREPVDLGLPGGHPRPGGGHLAGEPGQPLAAVGERAGGGDPGPLGLGERGLELGPLGDDGGRAGRARPSSPAASSRLGGGDPLGLGVQLVGIAAAGPRPARRRTGGGAARRPAGRSPRNRSVRADSRYQVSEALCSSGALGGQLRSPAPTRAARRRECARSTSGAPLAGRRLVGDVPVEGVAQLHQVVGQQPQPGVAQVGLHAGGAAGHLGLPAQRLELAAQLGGEVGQPVEVVLHPVELAERLLLALAVLEDAGGLLDEGAPVLGAAGEDGVELALADDDVHLAADAGVAEQLLDVEQPDLVAVDLVLALAGAVHAAGDRHLGVVDRQGAVGVVDRQRHLGAAEGGAAGGAGEDDVLHLAAAQALGALLAEHPGDGVDDVGLARPVGADDGGDARAPAAASSADAKDLKPLSVRLERCTEQAP